MVGIRKPHKLPVLGEPILELGPEDEAWRNVRSLNLLQRLLRNSTLGPMENYTSPCLMVMFMWLRMLVIMEKF